MPRLCPKTVPVLFGAALLAFLPAPASAREVLDRFAFDLTGGYRVDQLDFNIAGDINGHNPDVLSELTWTDLQSYQVSARGKMIFTSAQVPVAGAVRLGLSYGDIFSGENQDSDYHGDGRSQEFSRSNNRADSGEVWDGSVGGGMVFFNRARTFSLTPLVGYSLHRQNLTMEEGYQTLSAYGFPVEVGPFAGLHGTYEAKWHTGWLGVDLDYLPTPQLDLHGTVELHGGKYEADADWNLRGDLAHPRSFSHTADKANGVVANIGMRAGVRSVLFTVDLNYQKWRAKDGVDRVYLANGAYGDTKLNEVNWEAASINAGVTVLF